MSAGTLIFRTRLAAQKQLQQSLILRLRRPTSSLGHHLFYQGLCRDHQCVLRLLRVRHSSSLQPDGFYHKSESVDCRADAPDFARASLWFQATFLLRIAIISSKVRGNLMKSVGLWL